MIVIKLKGGMGNQMFQYAFARYLSWKHNTGIKFDLSYLNERENIGNRVIRNYDLDVFGIEQEVANVAEVKQMTQRIGVPIVDKVINKVFGEKKTHLLEKDLHFCSKYLNAAAHIYLDGYFASQKYFEAIKEVVKKDFTVKEPMQENSIKLMEEIRLPGSVCVNVRRGDFITNPTHNICSENYYYMAEEILIEKEINPRFYVFSDDIKWCEENLKFSVPTTFVTHEYKGRKFQDYFQLMSACRNFIIPNSTFAWWAAYLNNDEDKVVVVPKRWLNIPGFRSDDILLDNWIKLDL